MKLTEVIPCKDSREIFNESWLMEFPMRTQPVDLYYNLVSQINDLKKSGYYPVISLSDNWKKIKGQQLAIYWFEENDIIIIGALFSISKQSYAVDFSAKNKEFKGKPPYASDLYNIVLNDIKDNELSIRVDSDKRLSDEGFSVWQMLLIQGHTIHVYDVSNPGQSFTQIKTIDDLKQYFDADPQFEKFRYVLSENTKPEVILRCNFKLRKMREENNLL